MSTRTEVCVLSDGRRIKHRVDKRSGGPFYYAYFRGPDGRRREVSTNETNLKRARDSAVSLIAREYQPAEYLRESSWEDAIEKLVEHMEGKNLRPNTIETYRTAIRTFRVTFPEVPGPGWVTSGMAEDYKLRRIKLGKSPYTVAGDLNELSTVFGKWWCGVCKVLDRNPFEDVDPPTLDKLEPRFVERVELEAFMDWLAERWGNWRLPLLFLEVKASIGCRIHELAAMPTGGLADGRVKFDAVTSKGRRTRHSKLPEHLYRELQELAGSEFVFERFPDQLRDLLLAKRRPQHARCVKFPFDPCCLVNWLQDRLVDFRRDRREIGKFKLHNLRGTAMSRAKDSGVSYDEAAIAFGCHPETMRRHYIKRDETAISDAVMDRVQAAAYNRPSPPASDRDSVEE